MIEVAPESSMRKQSARAFKPLEDTKAVQIDPEDISKTVWIGCGLSDQQERELVDFYCSEIRTSLHENLPTC